MSENYYLLLNLSVESLVGGQAALEALEKQLKQWKASNNPTERDKAEKYDKPIREAISNPAEWKKQYDEAVTLFMRTISMWINTVRGKGYITPEEIESRAKSITVGKIKGYKVSTAYLTGQIRSRYPNLEIRNAEAAQSSSNSAKKLADYKSAGELKFKTPAKSIEQLSCTDYYDFLQKYQLEAGTAFSSDTKASICVRTAEEIAKNWRARKENAEKSAVQTVCTTVIEHFDKPNDPQNQAEYNKYLIYMKLKAILDGLRSNFKGSVEKVLDDSGEADYIKQITEVISNRNDAQSILAAFCDENDIQLPKKIVQQGMCPFCNQLFQKNNGKMPPSCPVCRKSFLLKCPQCEKDINYADVRICTCGFHTDHYPRLAKKCEEARAFISTLNFSFAESRIAEVQAIWNNFPLLDEIIQELKKRREEAGAFITRLNDCLKAHKFQSAQKEYAALKRAVPGYSDPITEEQINTALHEAHNLYTEALKSNDGTERLKKLLQVTQLVADHSDAIRELGNIQPEPVNDLILKAEQIGGFVDLKWSSRNPSGTAEYIILRKPHSFPVSTTDSKIASVNECAYCDRSLNRGIPYYYAVYAVRGANHSQIACSDKPVLLFPNISDMHILPTESSLLVSWNTNIGDLEVEVFRVESEGNRQYGAGMPIRSVTKNSFEDSGLHLGRRYFYNVFLTAKIKNEKRVSQAFPVTASPIKISEPISFMLEQDDSGNVRMKINRELEPDEKIVFYRCDQPTALPVDRITTVPKLISELRLQQLSVKKEEDGSYLFKPKKNEKGYVYAIAVRGETAVIGNEEYYENLETIEVVNQRSDGVNMFLELKKWPENIHAITVVFRPDKYPMSPEESGANKIQINSLTYKTEQIKIPYQNKGELYAAGFVRSANGHTRIFRTKIGKKEKLQISYYFAKGLFSGRRLIIHSSEAEELPEMILVYRESYPPSGSEDGTVLLEIPKQGKSKSFEIPIRNKPNTRKGVKICGKLFLKDPSLNDRYLIMIEEGHTMEL